MKYKWALFSSCMLVAGCTHHADLPVGAEAYSLIPPAPAGTVLREYRIEPADHISVIVYREPDLSMPDVTVDTGGRIGLPLLGPVQAAGMTSDELAASIRTKLASQYVRDPSVTVSVASAVSQRVVVDGSVTAPGIYDLRGRTTLTGALAMARGPDRVAALDEIAIFRVIDGQMQAAKFDLQAIRLGKAPDPEILPNDRVVVGFSGLKAAWRDFLTAVPAAVAFRPLYN